MAKKPSEPKPPKKPVIPLKEQPGYCRSCARHSFKLSFGNGDLMRTCNGCDDEIKL